MSGDIHQSHDGKFKLNVALAAIKGDKTIEQLCKEFSIATCQIYAWKKQLEELGDMVYMDKRKTEPHGVANEKKLQATIEKLTAERDFLARVLNR